MNVLVLMLDTVRPDFLGAGGSTVCKTPALDRFASEGAFFENAYAEYPITIPTRTALVSGIYTFTNRPWTPLRPYDLHIAEVFREHGYRTAAFTDSPFREAFNMHRGFEEFIQFPGKLQPPPSHFEEEVDEMGAAFPAGSEVEQALWRNCARGFLTYFPRKFGRVGIELMADEAIAWLEKNAGGGPFFLWLDSFQPHEPWVPPEPYRSMYQNDYRGRFIPMPAGPSVDWMTAEELEHVKALHMGEVTYTDAHVGRLLARLDELGLSEDTFVFVVSDHGMPLGDHGTVRKFGVPVYDELAKVVWIMRKPGLTKEGMRVRSLVQTTDFLPTMLELCGMEAAAQRVWVNFDRIDAPKGIDGVSLVPILSGKAESVRDAVYSGAFGLRSSIRRGPWKMIDNRGEKGNELFNLDEDPLERDNRYETTRALADELHRELWEFEKRWGAVLAWRDEPARPDEPRGGR